ncbi:MAG TPA: hypothetical protein VMV45_09640, partial [Casimicrobiaceae bacterium]|nr:hypothetical protein [Casimicrobiaceae bacterium]
MELLQCRAGRDEAQPVGRVVATIAPSPSLSNRRGTENFLLVPFRFGTCAGGDVFGFGVYRCASGERGIRVNVMMLLEMARDAYGDRVAFTDAT